MMLEGIFHKCGYNDCYCLNKDELVINLHANKTVKQATLVCDDPYSSGISNATAWNGIPHQMIVSKELGVENIFSIKIKPQYKRLQYYFILKFEDESETCLLEDGFHELSYIKRPDIVKHYYKFGWMNESDISNPPKWIENTIWYQIFPDRFCRVDDGKGGNYVDWNDVSCIDYKSLYGGNIKGIESKLEYLKDLGITGIYFNPLFRSSTNHKYNTEDYLTVDPCFGTNEELTSLVKKAHALGIKVMLDAVFNHTSRDFFAFKDILKNGKNSEYYDWYYINSDEYSKKGNTKDGRYYSFAFVSDMPKLNTNNKAVVDYFSDVCKKWIELFDIDGIRFDVGNEISHSFIKHLHKELKQIKPDLFLLGEIWTDSTTYLDGDEYDSVMNYPYEQSLLNFYNDKKMTAMQFKYLINYCYSLYKEQNNYVLFNQLDSHDVGRIITRVGSYDGFIQLLTMLMTMPGTPCLYYGTEIALDGQNDPYNRKPMPWTDIDLGKYNDVMTDVKNLIAIRKLNVFKSSADMFFENTDSRLIHYVRNNGDSCAHVYINANEYDIDLKTENTDFFSYKYENSKLQKGGVLVEIL